MRGPGGAALRNRNNGCGSAGHADGALQSSVYDWCAGDETGGAEFQDVFAVR